MFKCKYCGKEFDKKESLGGHIIWCNLNPNKNGKSNFKNTYNNLEIEDLPKYIQRECKHHGLSKFVLRTDGSYRCAKCSSESVILRRKKVKEELVEYKGGKCEICGYNKCIAALEFHHIDSNEKDFAISSKGITISIEKMKKEVDKCMLLCSNCHKEVHYKNILGT